MAPEGNEKKMVVTQVSIGGFGDNVTAKMLSDFLENEVAVTVWRCRLKTSWTPLDSYPDFDLQVDNCQRTSDYDNVEPHAFVHLDSSDSVNSVLDAAARRSLLLGGNSLRVSLGPENPFQLNQRRRTTIPLKMSDVSLDVGTLTREKEFLVSWSGPSRGFNLLVDPFDGTCKFLFTRDTVFAFKDERKHAVIKCNFKVEFMVREIDMVREYKDFSSLVIVLQMASSPLLYYRTADDDVHVPVSFDLLDDDDPWIRTTDFTFSGAMGRCNYYAVTIPPRNGPYFKKILKYLEEQRVSYTQFEHRLRVEKEPNFGLHMADPFFCIQHENGLSFDVKFMLNAVLHKGIVNQYQLSSKLFSLLRAQPEEVTIAALQHICSYKHPVFDAAGKFELVRDWLLKTAKMPNIPKSLDDFVQIRRLVITPTKAYCLPPEVELSNRVVRHYKDVADRFLRVTFTDEGMQSLKSSVLTFFVSPIVKEITSNSFMQRTTVFRRINFILRQGFYLCGRRYSFLAFSANQLRDQSAWFFAEDHTNNKNLTVTSIIKWMGKFKDRNVAKCAARMGQCFSSTYATIQVPHSEVNFEFPDVKRNGYLFSDGIGMITPDLALKVAEKLQLKENPPCAYQIRYAGCKGVVACWPAKEENTKLYLRPSMNKFFSTHTVLEACSWTRFQPGFMNRQIVTLLSALELPDETFWKMQETMIDKLDDMFHNPEVAFDVLTQSCAEHGYTAAIMLSSGFKPQTEPHLHGMLACIRASQLHDLREKARIFVPKGRWLMGCLDELGILEQGQCFIQVSNPSLENTFHKHGSRFSETTKNLSVITGLVIIAKNPCLHPGDIRILEAVDVPDLHHLLDCVVFPKNGERPHPNEASGSDLDGDLYFAAWEEDLIPPKKRSLPPMDYAPILAKELTRPVNTLHIIDFFTKNMVNEQLGTICNAHVVHADISDSGALDEKCLRLAELAATAVDFPKTGKVVTMPLQLKPKMYPDFMGKPAFQTYKSQKIQGRMYRRIKDTLDKADSGTSVPTLGPEEVPFDADLDIPGSECFLNETWDLKCSYEVHLSGLLGQYRVNREEELVTGHVWSMPKYSSRKQGELKEKLKHAYSGLKKEFRMHFDNLGSEYDHLSLEERNNIYEKKASAWYVVSYHPDWVKRSVMTREPEGNGKTVMLSFPWIAADYLARIKVRRGGMGSQCADSSKPINSLAKFLALRI